jgi:excisionase family DNA binding protein
MDAEKLKERLLVKPSEAAALLGVSRSSVYELVRAGAIPSVRIAGMIRISVDQLRKIANPSTVQAE